MNAWVFEYDGFDPQQEKLRETLCTLGNGYFATRGAAAEAPAGEVHHPGTYLAGGYNRLTTEVAGRDVENEDLVNMPNWLPLNFRINDGAWFDLQQVEILDYKQLLHLKKGLLERRVRFLDQQQRETEVVDRRFVHMSNPHYAGIERVIKPLNWSGSLEVVSALDGRVINSGVARYQKLNQQHLEPVEEFAFGDDCIYLKARTVQSELQVAEAARTRIRCGQHGLKVKPQVEQERGYIAQQFRFKAEEGQEIAIEKIIAFHTSRDSAISECGLDARNAVLDAPSFDELLATHKLAWEHLWRRFDMGLELENPQEGIHPELILRLHIFHLLQTTSTHTIDLDVGVPSRGWHGEAYRGHIFWDELFIFPLLNLQIPEITRSLLIYRYRRLPEARKGALAAGFRGAMFPWQSGSNGREETQVVHLNPKSGRWLPDHSHLQRHVNAAIAFNIWNYYEVTHDAEFLMFHGAEMMLEIARFWASAASLNEKTGRYEIHRVMGPDEYHDAYPDSEETGLRNNAYTNVMAAWVLARALDTLKALPADRRLELCEILGLTDEETARWDEISRKLCIPFHGDGIISQFEGYEKLEEFPWTKYIKKYGRVLRLDRILEAEGDTVNRYKASKQADVLMLFYLFSIKELGQIFQRLGYDLDEQLVLRNIEYYLHRTSHGSTLSQVVHSWVLARADRKRAWELFTMALESDVSDVQGGTTPEGIHLGAMAGTVDLVQRCFTGLETRAGVLWFDPALPENVVRLCMVLRYRHQTLKLEITQDELQVKALRCDAKAIRIGFRGEVHKVREGETKQFEILARENTESL